MIYLSKIKEYLEGESNPLSRELFEQELAENVLLQQEFEAYKTATALANFTAKNLSEREIVEGISLPIENNKVFKDLSINRILSYTTLVLLLVAFGLLILTNNKQQPVPAKQQPPIELTVPAVAIERKATVENEVAELSSKPAIISPKADNDNQNTTIFITPSPIVDPISNKQNTAPSSREKETTKPLPIAVVSPTVDDLSTPTSLKLDMEDAMKKSVIANVLSERKALVLNEAITGDEVVFNAENNIVLAPGFEVPSGTTFTARNFTTSINAATQEKNYLTSREVISSGSVVYSAGESITLSPGFHVAQGASFSASISKD